MIKLVCEVCPEQRTLVEFNADTGRPNFEFKLLDQPNRRGNTMDVSRPHISASKEPDGWNIDCHEKCGARYLVTEDELAAAASRSPDRDRFVAGAEVGERRGG